MKKKWIYGTGEIINDLNIALKHLEEGNGIKAKCDLYDIIRAIKKQKNIYKEECEQNFNNKIDNIFELVMEISMIVLLPTIVVMIVGIAVAFISSLV